MAARAAVLIGVVVLLAVAMAGFATIDNTPLFESDENETLEVWETYEANESLDINESEGLDAADVDSVVNRSMARVEAIRDVRFEERPNVTVIDRETFRNESTVPTRSADTRTFDNVKLRALFFLDGEEDIETIEAELRNETVGGYYSTATGEIVLIADDDDLVLDEITLAHELVHAWQDQHMNLSSIADADTRDGQLARLAVIEGDAVYAEERYEQRCEAEWECVRPEHETEPDGDIDWGLFLRDFHPYSDGPALVNRTYEQGGWDAVNNLYENPPNTTAEVIDPNRSDAIDISSANLTDAHRGEWERLRPSGEIDHQRLGQASMSAMFAATIYEDPGHSVVDPDDVLNFDHAEPTPRVDPLNYDISATSGWTDDRFHAYVLEDEETGWVWRSTWESDADAEAFAQGYGELVEIRGGQEVYPGVYRLEGPTNDGAYAMNVSGDTVTLVYASDEGELLNVSTKIASDVPIEPEHLDDVDNLEAMPGFGVGLAIVSYVAAMLVIFARHSRGGAAGREA